MRYYKFSNVDDIIKKVSDEIINISYNKKYYVDEILQENPEEEYNTYDNNGIIYNFEIQSGILTLLIEKKLITKIFTKLSEVVNEKVNMIISAGIDITDYYILRENTLDKYKINNMIKKKVYKPIIFQFRDIKPQDRLTIKYPNNQKNINDKIVWTITWQYMDQLNTLDNVSGIVVDGYKIFDIKDGYRSLDIFTKFNTYLNTEDKYCAINHCFNVKNYITCNNFDQYLLIKYIIPSVKNPLNILYKINIKRTLSFNAQFQIPLGVRNGIFWIKYEDLNLINFQINMVELKYISLDKLPKFNPKINKLKCAISDIPIYDDFYIIDIYEQVIVADNKNLNYEKLGYVKINCVYTKTIKYDKPMQLAVSHVILNMMCCNILLKLDSLKIKYIIYRSKYNRNIHNIIDDFDITLAHKKILHSDMNYNKIPKYNFKYIAIHNGLVGAANNNSVISKSFLEYKDIVCDINNI